MNEDERVALLSEIFARHDARVIVGIGDDAAVLEGGLVWTVDAQVDGVHFRRAWLSWDDVGWRSFMAAASDLAAMGAEPVAALSALVLPPDVDDEALAALARGQRAASDAIDLPIAGGNLSRGTELSITTTAIGRASAPVLRAGARAGDGIFVAGAVGLAGAGLAALASGRVQDARVAAALEAWRRPRARIAEGRAMAAVARAAIDVSDGLARDASHLAKASGVGIVLDAAAILAHGGRALAAAAAAVGQRPLDLALGGGEDYAIVVASPSPIAGFTRVGAVESGDASWLEEDGQRRPLEPKGFDHFTK
jgi:thiamine-monophosphate kinase